jgi:hypothetical protein
VSVAGLHWGACDVPLRPNAYLRGTGGLCALSKRVQDTPYVSGLPGTWCPAVHALCGCNERASLMLRTLGATPPVLGGHDLLRGAFSRIRRLARGYRGTPWSLERTALSYEGALRRRYVEAAESLSEFPLRKSDWFLSCFLKADKFNVAAKFAKPRMIFPRSPRYNLCLARYLKPFEHWLWSRLVLSRGVPPTRVSAKGLNSVGRAELIAAKMGSIPGCVVLEVDGSAFEAHVLVEQLREEFRVYLTAYRGDPGLQSLLSRQYRNRGRTRSGISFARDGGRASGDFNTGMGNTLICLAACFGVLRGEPCFDLLADGDNCLLFLPPLAMARVRGFFRDAVVRDCGHEMVLERPVVRVEDVVFGQSHPVLVGGVWTMLRDWRKVVSNFGSSHRWHRSGVSLPYIAGVARCELALSVGVPVLQRFCEVVLSSLSDVSPLSFEFYRDYAYLGVTLSQFLNPVSAVVEDDTRVSFGRAFSLEPSDQAVLESSFSFTVSDLEAAVLDRSLWLCSPGLVDSFFDSL